MYKFDELVTLCVTLAKRCMQPYNILHHRHAAVNDPLKDHWPQLRSPLSWSPQSLHTLTESAQMGFWYIMP